MASVQETLERITKELDSLDVSALKNDFGARKAARAAAYSLHRRLENPWDSIVRMFWEAPTEVITYQIALNMGLFEKLNQLNDTKPSIAELCAATGAEHHFLKRILRSLSTRHIVTEVEKGRFQMTALSREMLTPEGAGCVRLVSDLRLGPTAGWAEWFQQKGFKDPQTSHDCPWMTAMDTKESFFETIHKDPATVKKFGGLMEGYGMSRPAWWDWFPTEELFEGEDDPSTPFMVDVAGGLGHDIGAFLNKHPEAAGRLVLQDRPEMVAASKLDDTRIIKSGHDFFKPQIVKGAKYYFLHSIIHDWPDKEAVEILKNLKPAMRKGYSKIMLNERAMKYQGASTNGAAIDVLMMSIAAGIERDEDDWAIVCKEAGLKITGIREHPMCDQGIIFLEIDD